ncbi:MAG: HAD family hydrolase [Treponema sp.]|jgi:phosphoglycolate phosphatase|nr:HAD family hydrolase [Treponema sp.]
MRYSCVIFDLDGTLANTIEDIALSMNRALEYNGFPPVPPEEYREIVGWGIEKLALAALPESLRKGQSLPAAGQPAAGEAPTEAGAIAQKVAADAARFYAEKPLVRSAPYPGIPELLSGLGRRKVKMAVISNKPDFLARLVVQGLFPSAPFALIRGEVPGTPRKPNPESSWEILAELGKTPGDTIFVGDSEIDMETALAAGCYPLGAGWGFRPRRAIEAAGAARVIDRPEELLELFR